jgi:hypothetical protein
MGEPSQAPVNAIDGCGVASDRLRAALDASCVVGTWAWDIVRGTMMYDAGAAQLLTGDPSLADTEISGPETMAAVHPDDHPWLLDHVQRAVKAGGLVLAEYRVVAQDGTVRWLLSRGRTFQDPVGRAVRAGGILIVITEMRAGGDRPVLCSEAAPADALDRAADLAIALKRTLGDSASAEIRAATDILLMTLGRAIAQASDRR